MAKAKSAQGELPVERMLHCSIVCYPTSLSFQETNVWSESSSLDISIVGRRLELGRFVDFLLQRNKFDGLQMMTLTASIPKSVAYEKLEAAIEAMPAGPARDTAVKALEQLGS